MKKWIWIFFVLFLCKVACAADTKITEYTEDTAPTSDDLMVTVNDPAGTPANKKVTLGNAIKAMNVVDAADWPSGLDVTELSYVNEVTSAIQTQINAQIPKSTIAAAGDVLVGTAASTPGVITKGANNTVLGVNNSGTLGFYDKITLVLTGAPADDDTYSGIITTVTAGEAVSQWDVLYAKNKSGVEGYYKYDADGTDKAYPPRCVAVAAISADASGTCLTEGIVRNDGWAMTTNQDEGKKVYASTTAGGITLTEPSTDGVIVGEVREQNVVHFKFPNDQACTGSGAPVRATSPFFLTSMGIPVDGTVDAAGEITVDTTTDQLRYYGGAARSLPYKKSSSIVVPGVVATDDMIFMKIPYGITALSLDCIVSAATSATINIQECDSTGASCSDMATSDLVCDTDGANTTTFGGAAGDTADSGDWLKLDVASISGTPGTLTVTFTYSVVAD